MKKTCIKSYKPMSADSSGGGRVKALADADAENTSSKFFLRAPLQTGLSQNTLKKFTTDTDSI